MLNAFRIASGGITNYIKCSCKRFCFKNCSKFFVKEPIACFCQKFTTCCITLHWIIELFIPYKIFVSTAIYWMKIEAFSHRCHQNIVSSEIWGLANWSFVMFHWCKFCKISLQRHTYRNDEYNEMKCIENSVLIDKLANLVHYLKVQFSNVKVSVL